MLAGTTMLIAVSIMMSFPNLNTYMISYMRARTDPEYAYSDFIWISQGRSIVCGKVHTMWFIFRCDLDKLIRKFLITISGLTGMVGGIIASKVGLKATLIFGSSLYRWASAFISTPDDQSSKRFK